MTFARRLPLAFLGAFMALAIAFATPAGAASGPKAPSSVNIAAGSHTAGGPGAMSADDGTEYQIASAGRSPDKVRFVAKYTGLEPDDERLVIRASVSASEDCQASVELYDFNQGRWEVVALFPVSPTESDPVFDIALNGYVSNRGITKARVTCTTNRDFVLRVDQLTAETYTAAPPSPAG